MFMTLEERQQMQWYRDFMETCKNGDLEGVKWLIGQGFRVVDYDSDDFKSGFSNAIASGNVDLINYLWSIYDPPKNAVIIAASHGHLNLVKMFEEKGFTLGDNEAICAAHDGKHWDVVDYLLKQGATYPDSWIEEGLAVRS